MTRRQGRIALAVALGCALGFALALAYAAAGCGRRTTLARGGDSTAIAVTDSFAVYANQAQSLWESGNSEDAAQLSATVLFSDLWQRPSEKWESRARALLDSLANGSEVAGVPCAVLANLFARSDPDAGSWPYLISCGDSHPHLQPIEGKGLHLAAAALGPMTAQSRPWLGPVPVRTGRSSAPSALAVLFSQRAGGGEQPLVMVWAHPKRDEPWTLLQTLGADSLGGVGTAQFQTGDSLTIVTRTYQPSHGFEECASCPHLIRSRKFRWRDSSFVKVDEQRVPSPYGTFVIFIAALSVDDRDAAGRLVTDSQLVDRARKLDWGKPHGAWRVAPETGESSSNMVFFRGREEAYRVDFVQQGHDWKIAGFEPTTRSIE